MSNRKHLPASRQYLALELFGQICTSGSYLLAQSEDSTGPLTNEELFTRALRSPAHRVRELHDVAVLLDAWSEALAEIPEGRGPGAAGESLPGSWLPDTPGAPPGEAK